MKKDLTLSKIKNTNFSKLYDRFIIGQKLSHSHYEVLLAIAICFINAEENYVQQLGYRIIVSYCNQTQNYIPLYEIAINSGLYPVSKYIEEHYISDERKNFFTEWNDAFTEQYADKSIYHSEQQRALVNFFVANTEKTLSVIAPTSYGKSELILFAVKAFAGKKICILTSTKALLMQTKKNLQSVSREYFSKIVIHPEMYDAHDPSCLAVLTQERLLRLFKTDPSLAFDCIIIDEAHEMLENNTRSLTLSDVIIIAQKRNPDILLKFLTPFLTDANNQKIRYTAYEIKGFKVSEYIKSEKYYIYDLKGNSGLQFYDQFFNKIIPVQSFDSIIFEEEVVKTYSAQKNIVYLNKPADIEEFALALADILPDVQSDTILSACADISNYLQSQYNLLTCLKKGIIYHHGSVPDAIRIYIEELYKREPSIKYVVSNSTLLSGVNLPAERIFILDNRRGRPYLKADSFKNLVGRVCRFSEVFDDNNGSLKRLEPEIYLVVGKYFPARVNYRTFIQSVAKVESRYQDDLGNVLLENTHIDATNHDVLIQASEFIENYENGVVCNYQNRYTKTEVGKACIMNGISEVNVFDNELSMQTMVDSYKKENLLITDSNTLLEVIYDLFLRFLPEKGFESLIRLENREARKFYAMMLDWRISNKSYAEMINLFVSYWRRCYQKNADALVYVGRWGDVARSGSNNKYYTYLRNKDRKKVINLAIVRIKEEQDFIDNVLIKFIETIQDLGMIEETFYKMIKYGTDDEFAICLLKNGLSLSLTLLLLEKYRDYLQIDVAASTVSLDDTLIDEMKRGHENQILIFETRCCM